VLYALHGTWVPEEIDIGREERDIGREEREII
jgi:hypothetical protein